MAGTLFTRFCLLFQLRKEKEAVEKASEGAFQAYNMVKEQLELTTRERDMARYQV